MTNLEAKKMLDLMQYQHERDKSLNRVIFLSILSWSISIFLFMINFILYSIFNWSELFYRVLNTVISIIPLIIVVILNVKHNIKYSKKTRNSL